MVPPLQEMLQAALRRLQKEQQKAEELEADIREQRTSCKVGGEASYGVSKVVIWARSSVLITRKPLPLVAWHGWIPETILPVLPPLCTFLGGRGVLERGHVTSSRRHWEWSTKAGSMVRKAGQLCRHSPLSGRLCVQWGNS